MFDSDPSKHTNYSSLPYAHDMKATSVLFDCWKKKRGVRHFLFSEKKWREPRDLAFGKFLLTFSSTKKETLCSTSLAASKVPKSIDQSPNDISFFFFVVNILYYLRLLIRSWILCFVVSLPISICGINRRAFELLKSCRQAHSSLSCNSNRTLCWVSSLRPCYVMFCYIAQ